MMNYIDLFSGIGGFALGAYWAGVRFDEHYFSEVDKYCIDLYSRRFPEAISLGDITNIKFEDLPEDNWIITGGFPCQDISIAGKGEGISGKRSSLWFAMLDVIRVLRPRFVIAENVGAITFQGLDIVLGTLAEIGYDAEWQDIRASDMGAPHRRERIWIIAYPSIKRERGLSIRQGRSQQTSSNIKRSSEDISDTIGKHDDNAGHGASEICWERSEEAEVQGCMADTEGNVKNGIRRETLSESHKGDARIECSRGWELEPDVGRLAHGVSRRVDRLKGLGNAIVPQIAELLFRRIKELI